MNTKKLAIRLESYLFSFLIIEINIQKKRKKALFFYINI